MNIPAAQLQRICRNGERDTVRRKPVDAGRATLQPCLMTKHSSSRYCKLSPGFLHHLALARGAGTKSQSTIVYRVATFVPAFSVARAQLVLDGFARSVDQRLGLLCPVTTVHPQDHGPGTPILGPRVSDLGPLVLAL